MSLDRNYWALLAIGCDWAAEGWNPGVRWDECLMWTGWILECVWNMLEGGNKKVCQIMKLTVDRGCFRCYISWAVGNNCFLKRDNLRWFLKEKRNLKKCLTTWNKRVKVIKSLEQSRQSQIRRTVRKSGRVRKTLKKLEKSSWQRKRDVIK